MSQQVKQLEDRISRLESDLKQLQQRLAAMVPPAEKRGPGRPKKDQ